jgi:hypothetical protein
MKIFPVLKEEEGCFYFYYPLVGRRLEPRGGPPKKSGVTTSPLDQVTVFLVDEQIF